jgi:hypothetical protein
MSKLYVFGIGGTGSRVIKSLTMLLAAGVECGVDTIVPIIIDRDESNRDFTRTKLLIEDYVAVNKIAETKGKNKFFKTKIELLNNELTLRLKDNTQKFDEFIGKNSMSKENHALVEMLFSEDTLKMDMSAGFQGNPNIGSVVLNQFDESEIFKSFASDFQEDDKIFIISSIFGGTGASGFPLLRKVLATINQKDSQGVVLPKWGLVNKAPIGAISVLPYFQVKHSADESLVDSDTFTDKAKAALSYYKQEDKKIDTLYYIADKRASTYEHNKGGDAQRNNAHFVELAAALSILNFVNPKYAPINLHRDSEGKIESTTYKEFGVVTDTSVIDFSTLDDSIKKLLVNPMSRFMLFCKYMGYYNVNEHVENNSEIYECSKVADNPFDKERKFQPYAYKNFDKYFRGNSVIKRVESVQSQFCIWLYEMEKQNRQFSPFNLKTKDPFDFVKNVNIKTETGRFKNWVKMDNELNRFVSQIDLVLEPERRFLELFYLATESLLNFKN